VRAERDRVAQFLEPDQRRVFEDGFGEVHDY
jgi:uncharacterized membrane protein